MAWNTCEWCGVKSNGYDAGITHGKTFHEKEAALKEAKRLVKSWEDQIPRDERNIANLKAILAWVPDASVPQVVKDIVAHELKDFPYSRGLEDMMARAGIHKERLAEAQAALDKLMHLQPVS
mgnify:CR=1 FL=1